MATCEAPGHPDCAIECPGQGCVAIFTEPYGPCRTMCVGSLSRMDLSTEAKYSLNVSGMPSSHLARLFGKFMSAESRDILTKHNFTIAFSLLSASVDAIVLEIEGQIRGQLVTV